MKYDFDSIVSRRGYGESKWMVNKDELPMWIADMDFKTAPCIVDALNRRVEKQTFGYTEPEDDWYQAYIDFYLKRHHLKIEKDWLVFSLGVVPTISSSVRKLTEVGDKVILLTPVYNIFFNSIVNNQRVPLQVELCYEKGAYSIDFQALEKAMKEEKATLMILCNPQNPVSRIWTKEELDRIGRLAYENHVTVISDEIHCDLVRPGKEYVPFIQANDVNASITVMCISVTKSFSIPGIQTSAIVIPNPELRKNVVRQINTDEVAEPNVFSCVAAKSALNDGREWLDELRTYLFQNRDFASDYLKEEIPDLTLVEGDATYLLWIDVSRLNTDGKEFADFLRKETGLYVSFGNVYGQGGENFIRVNVACPRATLMDGLLRLKEGTIQFKKQKTEHI